MAFFRKVLTLSSLLIAIINKYNVLYNAETVWIWL